MTVTAAELIEKMPVNRDTDPEQPKQRTLTQNRSLHLFFTHVAAALNMAGFDMKRTLRHDIEIPWDERSVKEYLWRPVQDAQLGKESTTELTTKDIDTIYETLNRYLGERTGVHVPFPSIEEQLLERREK